MRCTSTRNWNLHRDLGRALRLWVLPCVALGVLACTQPGRAGEPEAVAGAAAATAETEAQTKVITDFYQLMISFKTGGLPTPKQMEQIAPLISKNLKALLLKAIDAEDRYQKGLKEPAPPLVEGAFYCSLFEGAERLGAITPEGTPATSFLVALQWTDSSEPKQSTQWQDRVFVVKEEGKWVVDDLELLGQWDFGPKGKLSYRLKFVAKQMEE